MSPNIHNYNAIVAMNEDNIIGINGALPWHIPEDLTRFRKLTQHHILVMGRKTYDSLPKRPLPKRIHIVLTRQPQPSPTTLVHSHLHTLLSSGSATIYTNYKHVEQWISYIQSELEVPKKVFVIGGEEIFRLFLPFCSTLYLTFVRQPITVRDTDTVARFPTIVNDILGGQTHVLSEDIREKTDTSPAYHFITMTIDQNSSTYM
jgi:dihydrofolate reductase